MIFSELVQRFVLKEDEYGLRFCTEAEVTHQTLPHLCTEISLTKAVCRCNTPFLLIANHNMDVNYIERKFAPSSDRSYNIFV